MGIYETTSGRFLLATWNKERAQFQAVVTPAPFQGYCYSYARSADGLASMGVRTYSTKANAKRALKRMAEFGDSR